MSDDNEYMQKIKNMIKENERKNELATIKQEAEPVVKEPYGEEIKTEEPKPKRTYKPRKPKNTVELSQDEFKALMAMAKKADTPQVPEAPAYQPTLGEVIEQEGANGTPIQPMQPEPIDVSQLSIQQDNFADILNKPMVLYFDTDKTCSMIQPKLNKDGSVKVHDRVFDFAEGQPSILKLGGKGGSKSHPFYVLKYDKMKPVDISKYPPSNPTPEETTRLVDLRTLETLSQISGAKLKKLPLIILMGASLMGGIVIKLILSLTGVW